MKGRVNMFNFDEISTTEFKIEFTLYSYMKKIVGDIVLTAGKVLIKLDNTLLSFYEQVNLFKEIVSRFNLTSQDNVVIEEIKNSVLA
jgi:hypothetical protein